MTACIFLVALGWKVLPWVRTFWVKRGKKSRNKFSGHSAGPTGSEMGKAVAHAGCPGVHAGKAMRGEAGVSEGEKRGGKLVS